jgi:hypothetical protein
MKAKADPAEFVVVAEEALSSDAFVAESGKIPPNPIPITKRQAIMMAYTEDGEPTEATAESNADMEEIDSVAASAAFRDK